MKKQIKDILLYSFDIDGTSNKDTYNLHLYEEDTKDNEEAFPKIFIESLIKLKLKKENAKLMITTGRSIDLVEPIIDALPWINNAPLFSYIGCVNGAFIYKWNQNNHSYELIKKNQGMKNIDATKILRVFESLNLPIFLQTQNLKRYYIKKNWNDKKYHTGLNLKKWTNRHITYEEFYKNVNDDILNMVLDTYLIGRPPLSDAEKYIYTEEQIHKHQRNRFNDKYMFTQALRELFVKYEVRKDVKVFVSGTNSVDVSHITKDEALKVVIEDMNINRDSVSHSGDNFNDLPAWKFLRSNEQKDIIYGRKRGICNAMSNTWDHLKLMTGDKIVETNTVSDFIELSINYDKITNFLIWDKTSALTKLQITDLIKELKSKYSEDSIRFMLIDDIYINNNLNCLKKENTMIIQINKVGSRTSNYVLKNFVKKLQIQYRIAKMHVYYDQKIKI